MKMESDLNPKPIEALHRLNASKGPVYLVRIVWRVGNVVSTDDASLRRSGDAD